MGLQIDFAAAFAATVILGMTAGVMMRQTPYEPTIISGPAMQDLGMMPPLTQLDLTDAARGYLRRLDKPGLEPDSLEAFSDTDVANIIQTETGRTWPAWRIWCGENYDEAMCLIAEWIIISTEDGIDGCEIYKIGGVL